MQKLAIFIFHYRYLRIHPFEDGERVNFRSDSTSKILNLMSAVPDITIAKLSDEVGINVAAVNKQLKQLTTKGYIQRVEKDGTWRLIITPSIKSV